MAPRKSPSPRCTNLKLGLATAFRMAGVKRMQRLCRNPYTLNRPRRCKVVSPDDHQVIFSGEPMIIWPNRIDAKLAQG